MTPPLDVATTANYSPVMDTGRRLGTAGFFPMVAKAGVSQVSSSDLTASSRLPSEMEKLSRAAAMLASLSRRSVTISDSGVAQINSVQGVKTKQQQNKHYTRSVLSNPLTDHSFITSITIVFESAGSKKTTFKTAFFRPTCNINVLDLLIKSTFFL